MKKLILFLVSILLFTGCNPSDGYYSYKEAKQIMLKKYGKIDVYVCENGFLVNRYIICTFGGCEIKAYIVMNDANVPTRCSDKVTIKVKETVATGALSGSVK